MSSLISLAGIAGTDGVTPVYDPDGRFELWALDEIYTGGQGTKRYVPKVGDWVVDREANIFYTVVSLDVTTLVPRLNPIDPLKQNQQFTNADVILGVGPGGIADTFRVYINKSVIPYTLTLDARLHTYTAEAERFTVFRGTDVEGDAKAISQIYNSSNQLVGTSVPLVLAETTGDNRTVKSFPMCYTTEDVPNGEVLVVITYSDAGHQVARCELIVEETQFVPVADASAKFVTGIALESPFLSLSDPNLLTYPMNVPVNGLSLIGVVSYNDGSKKRMPVNGTNFSALGLDNFISSYAGQKFQIVLNYKLAEGEVALGYGTTPSGSITRTYNILTTNFEGMYSPKLYGYPVWIDEVNGYRLEWWLYDMERRMAQLVTPYVKIAANSPAFNPIGYGYRQSLGVEINLKDVNPSGLALNHAQSIDFVLRQAGNQRTTNWAVGFIPHQEILFGENNNAKMTIIDQNLMKMNIGLGETDLDTWLERIYRLTMPLTDSGRETEAPDPTHFSICTPSWSVDYPLSMWKEDLSINYTMANSSTVFVKFFVRTPDTDIQLAIAGLPVYQQ